MYFTFSNPSYLFFLFAIPLLIIIHFFTLEHFRKRALRFANFEAIARVRGIDLFSKNLVIISISIAVCFFLTMAVSGLTLHKEAQASSFSFIIAIDSSRSMEATDIEPNRIDAAKQVAENFVDKFPSGTRAGVVSFSGNAFIEQDITDNKESMKNAIRKIERSSIEGTDISELVITSSNLLKREDSRAIVLLSDGQITVGSIEEAIEYANVNDVIIDTIAIGTAEGGMTGYGISKTDEDALKSLAYNTMGVFSSAKDRASLESSFDDVLKLTKKKVSIELSSYLIIASIFLSIVYFFLVSSRYRTIP